MTRILIHIVVFLAGLAVVGWVGVGYAGTNALALAVTLLIGGVYLTGAVELKRYRQATSTLALAVAGLSGSPASLATWLEPLHPSLRNAARLRVEGERTALPGPALTPYLVGLLVLLGMFGTFLGMVATLRGTGIALEGAADLDAIRASLAAPVKGLGFAFGTSVAGVATSAMLGLLSALCRRERIETAQALDARIATTLRPFSRTHQREEAFRLMQRQADVMPALVDRLEAMMTAMEQQNQAMSERLATSQAAFHDRTDAAYGRLAESVQQSLTQSIADSARTASAAIQPAVEVTMAGIARETAALHTTVTGAVQQQLDGLSTRFEATTATVADLWQQALAGHQRASEAQAGNLRATLDGFTQTFDQRSAGLLESVAARLDASAASAAETWNDALARQARISEKMAGDNQQAMVSAAAAFEQHAASLVQAMDRSHAGLKQELSTQDAQRLQAWAATLGAVAANLRSEMAQASAHTASRQKEIADALAQTARDISAEARTHASSTIAEIERLVQAAEQAPKAAVALQEELASRDQQRLSAWTEALAAMAASLRAQMEQASEQVTGRQQEIADTLAQTARDISAEARTHASSTIAEIERLVQAAEQAPKAAVTLQEELASRDQQRLSAWTEALAAMAASLRTQMEQTSAQVTGRQHEIVETLAQTARDMSAEARTHASSTIAEIDRLVQAAEQAPKAAVALQADMAAREEQRLAAWTETLGAMAAALRQEWERTTTHTASRQQEICDTLAQTTRDISAQTQAHASHTLAEVARLVEAATEAPKAAAEVIAELRQKLTDGMARDNAMLEERGRLLETLGTLLDAVNHASTEQRVAVDSLVATTADLLDRVGSRFHEQVESETGKLATVAAQVTGSAVEVASLGEALGVAVQMFSESNDKLMAHLERIETALDKSMVRSDEQLAYYVAQAREVVDLSMRSQKQVLEDLQQFAGQQAPNAEAA